MTTMVRNAWYVAAWSREIDDKLRRRSVSLWAVLRPILAELLPRRR